MRRWTTVCGLSLGVALVAGGLLALPARSDESQLKLVAAPGVALVNSRCAICHSVDYIGMNSPFLKRAGWEAEVRKMVKVMGAPIPEAEIPLLVEYLTAHYGAD